MSRNCPKCQLPLEIHTTNSVQVDYCKECRGVFLDYQEIQTLSQNKDDLPELIAGLESQLQDSVDSSDGQKKSCPKCEKPMKVKSEYGIEIDLCMFCAGIWFDSGELQVALHHFQQRAKQEKKMDEVAQKILSKELGIKDGEYRPLLADDPMLEPGRMDPHHHLKYSSDRYAPSASSSGLRFILAIFEGLFD